MVVVMGVGLKSRYQQLLLCMRRAFMEVVSSDGDRGLGTDLRGRSSVRICERTLRCDGGMGEGGLSRLLHNLLPQHRGALDHG